VFSLFANTVNVFLIPLEVFSITSTSSPEISDHARPGVEEAGGGDEVGVGGAVQQEQSDAQKLFIEMTYSSYDLVWVSHLVQF
jgi:hypothetical protein